MGKTRKTVNEMHDANARTMAGRIRKYTAGPRSKTKDWKYDMEELVYSIIGTGSSGPVADAVTSKSTTANEVRIPQAAARNSNADENAGNYPKITSYRTRLYNETVPITLSLTIHTQGDQVTLMWKENSRQQQQAKIVMYELYAYKETDEIPEGSTWKLIGNIRAYDWPTMCKLNRFEKGSKYYFALRAVDERNRRTPFEVVHTTIP